LEAWYCAREFLNLYTEQHVFGTKSQTVVAISLIISALVSLNAVTNYFSDSENIDWSNPGSSLSLINMLTLCVLLFLALVALEKINAETTKLVKKLDMVGIEVSRTSAVAQSARERLDADRVEMRRAERRQRQKHRVRQNAMRNAPAAEQHTSSNEARGIAFIAGELLVLTDEQEELRQEIMSIKVMTNDIVNRQEINTEYQYLTNIMAELRDQSESKKIFGIVVDRAMLSRIFGGVAFTIYLILKETLDSVIQDYAPPTFAGYTGSPSTDATTGVATVSATNTTPGAG
jgi:hypothetical protein